MAQIKNYGLAGVGRQVQLGKQGPHLKSDETKARIVATGEDGSSLVPVQGGNAVTNSDFITKAQLSNVYTEAVFNVELDYTDSSPIGLGNIRSGVKTIITTFDVTTAFDGDTVITVGTEADNNLLMSDSYAEIEIAGQYQTFNTVTLNANTLLNVYLTQSNASQGHGNVLVSVVDGPVVDGTVLKTTGADYISYGDLSVTTTAPAGNGVLTYNRVNGVFTFTPANTSITADFSTTNLTVTSDATVNGILKLDQVGEKLQSKSITGSGAFTFQCANGQVFYVDTPANNWTCNFTDLAAPSNYATAATIVIKQGATPYMPTGVSIAGTGATIKWQGGSAPTGTANAVDVVTFSILNVGGTYTVLGQSTPDFS